MWEGFEQHFHKLVLSNGSLVNHNMAGIALGEDERFQVEIPSFLLLLAQLLQVKSCIHIVLAISMVESIFQFLFQQLLVLLQLSIHQFEHYLGCLRAIVQEGFNNVFSWRISHSARWKVSWHFERHCNIISFREFGSHHSRAWNLPLFENNGKCQDVDEVLQIANIVWPGMDRISGLGGFASIGRESGTRRPEMATWSDDSRRWLSVLSG